MSTDDLITPVILSGGSGTRLWPISNDSCPKQFLSLTGPTSMFQLTLERCNNSDMFNAPLIVGSNQHSDLATEQMREIGANAQAMVLEPCARNTAPAIALAALACKNPQTPLLVMPSDHVIGNVPAFHRAVRQSLPIAKARWLVTFGIKATGPETGYGYIQQGDQVVGSETSYAAKRFVEKPNQENAQKMLDEGGYHWNAGIFLFRADSYLEALEKHAPEMLEAARKAMDAAVTEDGRIYPNADDFASAPSDSVDYAVMEKAEKVAVTPMNPEWSDVGSWDSLYEINPKDEHSNATSGKVTALESSNNLVHAQDIEIATFGVKDLIVVANGDQVLILPKGQSQNVKQIVSKAQAGSDS